MTAPRFRSVTSGTCAVDGHHDNPKLAAECPELRRHTRDGDEKAALVAAEPPNLIPAGSWGGSRASGQVNPIVERTYRLGEAAEALRHLIEDRPFGRVVLIG